LVVSKELVQNGEGEFRFLDPGELRDDRIILRLVATQPADPAKNWVPFYVFHIMSAKAATGQEKSTSGSVTPSTCACTEVMSPMEFDRNIEATISPDGRSDW
jgi:hypothetical protein